MQNFDGYPEQISHFDLDYLGLCLNNAVWDIQRGNVLRLAEGKVITQGYHGTKKLTE